jgi:hypothetical protein
VPAPTADATPTTLGVEGTGVASAGGAPMALPGEPGIEGFGPARAALSAGGDADQLATDSVELAAGQEPRREPAASAQRARDRWSLVPLGGALLLVLVTSAYDLRGRRRW